MNFTRKTVAFLFLESKELKCSLTEAAVLGLNCERVHRTQREKKDGSLLPRHDVHRPLMVFNSAKINILMSHEHYHSAGSFNFRNCWFPLMETNGAVSVPHKSIFSLSCRTNSSCNETETYFYLALMTAETIWLAVLMRFHLYMKLIFMFLVLCDSVFFLLFWCHR